MFYPIQKVKDFKKKLKIMKKIFIPFIIIFFAYSCKEELMQFDTNSASLYFEASGASKAFFASEKDTLEVEVNVNATGVASSADRTFLLRINEDSTNAVAGYDYEPLENAYTMSAGETQMTLKIKLLRNDSIDNRPSRLYLSFDEESNDFKPGPYEQAFFDIESTNVIVEPDYWPYTYGQFSPEKYKVFFQITGLESFPPEEEFQYSHPNYLYLRNQVGYALQTYWNENEVLDENGNPVPW